MSTYAFTKKAFLKHLEDGLKEEDIILLTSDLGGSLTLANKKQTQRVSFEFASESFARPHDVGHIAFGKTKAVAFCICEKERVSEKTLSLINK